MKRITCLVLAVVMAVCCFAGCGSSSGTPAASTAAEPAAAEPAAEAAASDGAFKLGCTGPLTGGAAIYGNAVKNGAQIAVDEVNALGGIQIELNMQDDTHDAEKAVNAYNTLKDWGMQVSLGSVTSKPCEATAAETYADRIFALTPSASSTAVTEGKDNMFQICFMDPNQGSASAQYISDKGMATKVAVIWKNDDVYSKGIHDTFVAKAPELGIEVVSDTTFMDGNDQDFSVQLKDAQDNGAELAFLPIYYQPAALILAQANTSGYAPVFFGVDGMDGILTLEGFNAELANGVMLLTPFAADSSDPLTVNFVTKYVAAYGDTPNQFAADAYDCVYAMYAAFQEAGLDASTSPEDACEALIATFSNGTFTITGVTGTMTWSDNGEVTKTPNAVIIKDGVYVSPENY